MKRHINEEETKRVVLPNAKEGIEKREEEQYVKKLISSMSKYYDAEDFWDVMGMVMFTSKKEFIIKDYPDIPFKFYMVYSNVNHKLSIRYKINADDDFNSMQYGHRWLDVRNVKIGNVIGLLKENGFLPPSVKKIAEVNGDDIFDNLRTDLSKFGNNNGNDTEETPTNIIKMNIKENRNMKQKQTVKINENQLRQIVTESVKRMLKEGYTNSTGEYVPDEMDMDKGAFADYKAVHNFGQKERKNINPNSVLRDAISGLRKIAGELSYLSVNYEHEVDYDFQPTREQSDIARKVVGKVSALAREIEASGAFVSNSH